MPEQTNEELLAKVKKLEEDKKVLEKIQSQALEENAKLQEIVESKKDLKAPIRVKIGGENYEITSSKITVKIENKYVIMTDEEFAKDSELCAKYLKLGSGFLRAVK